MQVESDRNAQQEKLPTHNSHDSKLVVVPKQLLYPNNYDENISISFSASDLRLILSLAR